MYFLLYYSMTQNLLVVCHFLIDEDPTGSFADTESTSSAQRVSKSVFAVNYVGPENLHCFDQRA